MLQDYLAGQSMCLTFTVILCSTWQRSNLLKWIQICQLLLGRLLHYWLWSFNTRDTKLERFLDKNQHTHKKLLNWCGLIVFKVDYFILPLFLVIRLSEDLNNISTPSPWLTRIHFTRISLTRIFKKFPFLT